MCISRFFLLLLCSYHVWSTWTWVTTPSRGSPAPTTTFSPPSPISKRSTSAATASRRSTPRPSTSRVYPASTWPRIGCPISTSTPSGLSTFSSDSTSPTTTSATRTLAKSSPASTAWSWSIYPATIWSNLPRGIFAWTGSICHGMRSRRSAGPPWTAHKHTTFWRLECRDYGGFPRRPLSTCRRCAGWTCRATGIWPILSRERSMQEGWVTLRR